MDSIPPPPPQEKGKTNPKSKYVYQQNMAAQIIYPAHITEVHSKLHKTDFNLSFSISILIQQRHSLPARKGTMLQPPAFDIHHSQYFSFSMRLQQLAPRKEKKVLHFSS